MRTAYRVLAIVIAVEVVVQAAAIVYAVSGLGVWVDDGGTFDKATLEQMMAGEVGYTGSGGFGLHAVNGMLIVALALALLVVSFFAKVPGGVKWAAITFGLVVLQYLLGILGQQTPYPGLLHGINAFGVFAMAGVAARKAGGKTTAADSGVHAEA